MNCIKCKAVPSTIKIAFADYCEPCLDALIQHRFRNNIQKSTSTSSFTTSSKVLVACSGGKSSMCLLGLLFEYCKERQSRSGIEVEVIHVDQSGILPGDLEMKNKIRNNAREMGFKYHEVALETSIKLTENESDEAARTRLCDTIRSTKSKTSQQASIELLTMRCILKKANEIGCTDIAVGDNSTLIACRILGGTAEGRGEYMQNEISLVGTGPVNTLRLLRDTTEKEIEIMNSIHKWTSFDTDQAIEGKLSIRELTKQFVTDLQSKMPGTISTITRTGFKIETTAEGSVICNVCGKENKDTTCYSCLILVKEIGGQIPPLEIINFFL